MDDTTTKEQNWSLVRIGKYAAAILPILGIAGLLLNFAVEYRQTMANVQTLVDENALRSVLEKKRSERVEALTDNIDQLHVRFQDTIDTLSQVINTQAQNTQILADMQASDDLDPSPAIRFPRSGHEIGDASIGGFARLTFTFYKLRDCGAPKLDLYFINGAGVRHRFKNPTIIDNSGRGVNMPVDTMRTQSLSYLSQVPSDDGVSVGKAQGWVEVSYPERCPAVKTEASPVLTFNILEKNQ